MSTFLILVLTHFAADFIFQGSKVALNKRGLNRHMLIHGLVSALAFIFPLINYPIKTLLAASFIIFSTHMVIDTVRVEIDKKLNNNPSKPLFWKLLGVDQALHVTIIYLTLTLVIN